MFWNKLHKIKCIVKCCPEYATSEYTETSAFSSGATDFTADWSLPSSQRVTAGDGGQLTCGLQLVGTKGIESLN